MSENLDLVRSIYAGWERGDYGRGDWAHPDIEFVMADGPDPGTWTGVAQMAEVWFGILGAWEDFRAEAEEDRELDDERVLVLDRRSGRGKTSGMAVGQVGAPGASLFHIRDGRVTKLIIYGERKHVLADLGLEK